MIRSGDQWEASVKPNDGDDFGEIVYTGVVVIGSSNNPPVATVYVSPVGNARTDDALQVNVGGLTQMVIQYSLRKFVGLETVSKYLLTTI